MNDLLRQSLAALRLLVVFTVLVGVVYPLAVWGVGRAFGDRADGQPLRIDGEVVGSRLLGQDFTGDQWFHPRPSAGGYDTLATGSSNAGPNNPDQVAAVEERRRAVAALEGVDPAAVPPDAVTASASGVDPHISPEYAAIQVARVARARGIAEADVAALVAEHTSGRTLGFLGAPRVNVVELNVALERWGT